MIRRELTRGLVFLAVYAAFFLIATSNAPAANEPPTAGGVLPSFDLTVPENAESRSYLGLSSSGQFTIPQIEAQVVIIEIFNMY